MYQNLSPQSRVWIYQSNRAFTSDEIAEINESLKTFTIQWAAHGQSLKAWGEVMHQHFIVLLVDQAQHEASGCSIDKSVHFIKLLEQQYKVQLFDRLTLAYRTQEGKISLANRMELMQLLKTGQINGDTIVFNNLVQSKAELVEKWEVKLSDSWAAALI